MGDDWSSEGVGVSAQRASSEALLDATAGFALDEVCDESGDEPREDGVDAAPDGRRESVFEEWLGPAMTRRLVALAHRFVSDRGEAEDVAQEALMRAREHLGTLRSPAKAEAWLFRICRHAAIDHARARRVRRAVWTPMPADGSPQLPPPVLQPLTPDDDERPPLPEGPLDLRALPAHQRVLVSLHYEHGISHPTLCRMTGLLPSALRVRLFRARGTLLSACGG